MPSAQPKINKNKNLIIKKKKKKEQNSKVKASRFPLMGARQDEISNLPGLRQCWTEGLAQKAVSPSRPSRFPERPSPECTGTGIWGSPRVS